MAAIPEATLAVVTLAAIPEEILVATPVATRAVVIPVAQAEATLAAVIPVARAEALAAELTVAELTAAPNNIGLIQSWTPTNGAQLLLYQKKRYQVLTNQLYCVKYNCTKYKVGKNQ